MRIIEHFLWWQVLLPQSDNCDRLVRFCTNWLFVDQTYIFHMFFTTLKNYFVSECDARSRHCVSSIVAVFHDEVSTLQTLLI